MTRESVVPVITARLPNYIREQYPVFAQFVEDYFNWLEYNPAHDPEALPGASPNFLSILTEWGRNLDADDYNVKPENDNDAYLNAILRDAGFILKRQLAIPKSMLLNSLRDFYLSRGSVQSFQYLFKLMFGDQSITITYPRDKMLVLSNANYGEVNYIYLTLDDVDLTDVDLLYILQNAATDGGTAHGSVSKMTAFVEDAKIQHYTEGEVLRLQIAKPVGEFVGNDQITVTVGDHSFTKFILNVVVPNIDTPGKLYQPGEFFRMSGVGVYEGSMQIESVATGSVEDIQIVNGGVGYSVGNIIRARPANNIHGRGFSAYVTAITPDGGIADVEVFDPGYGYDVMPTIYIVDPPAPPKPRPSAVLGFGTAGTSVKPFKWGQTMGKVTLTKLPPANPGGTFGPQWWWDGQRAKVTQLILSYNLLTNLTAQNGERAIAYLKTDHSRAFILGFTNTIGRLKKVSADQPYLILGTNIPTINVTVESEFGSGATFSFGTQTRFSTKAWTNQAGFLGINATLIDSNKYQQFSYEIETQEDPDLYLDAVDDLLHPVGYLRFTVSSREGVADLHLAAGPASVATQPIISGQAGLTETARDVVIESISEAGNILGQSFTHHLFTIVTQSGDSITFQD